ncbi:pentapeptide repeat-containing protein [Aliiroseovarius sp.]|uniref:pentapeptide repeat-containing protein n=1 Tax=Aliiroseovarius sp. TaxID=1872442 RepID=UPI003BAA95DF
MDDPARKLTPANENPWYVLMTLYGEQEGDEIDWGLHEKNRRAWNAWAGQVLNDEQRQEAAGAVGIKVGELWPATGGFLNVGQIYEKRKKALASKGFDLPAIPKVESAVDLSNTEFSEAVVLDKFVFTHEVSFEDSRFAKAANFHLACFDRTAKFNATEFHGGVSFRRTRFKASALFRDLMALHWAFFTKASFLGDSTFFRAKLSGEVSFKDSTFSREASFYGSTFLNGATFLRTTFCGSVDFDYSSFEHLAAFYGASFSGFAYFGEATFGEFEACEVLFSESQFEKPTTFRNAHFSSHYPDFSGAVLHDKTTFSARDDLWPSGPQDDPEQARASCAVIRHALGKQGLPEEEHFFFRREMGFAGQIGPWWQRLPYRLFGAVSGYGHSIELPLRWLMLTFGLPFGIYLAALQEGPLGADDAFRALGLCFSNTFRFFGFQRLYFGEFLQSADQLIAGLASAQTVFGYTFLFFLGLGLRTRFRLR